MLRRQHSLSSRYLTGTQPNYDDLVLRIRRLVQHRGYDRARLGSPLLKRLAPSRSVYGQPFPEADLRRRIAGAGLDGNAVSYLMMSIASELDLARLRLSEV